MSDKGDFPLAEPLSDREREILRLLADGLTNREIAEHLFLSRETVKWYNKQIYGKLGVSNRTQAASQARVLGALDSDGLPRAEPPPPPRHELPAQVTSFVGREQQIREIVDVLRESSVRLITLTGTGGIGKTRLALEVASRLSSEFADGIYLVNLAPTRQSERVADRMASALDLEIPPKQSAAEVLARYLKDRHILLVVDNFEQVLEAAPLLVGLLSSAAGLKFLVTSREALGAYGETESPVPPLSMPAPGHLEGVSVAIEYEAIALFAKRAQAANSGFRISEENFRAVAEICAKLDGLPLAIELAAATTKRLEPADLLVQFDRILAKLDSGMRGLPERQRSLHATITWSYDLLDNSEKTLFASLSVFRGSFALGAAEQVAGAGIDVDLERGIESLADKNLLVRHGRSGEDYRFAMLETIQQYASEQLALGGGEEDCRRRHADFFTRFAERAKPMLAGTEQDHWVGRIEADYENLRSALDWTLAGGDRELGLRLVAALSDYWFFRGPSTEALGWVELALESLEKVAPPLRAGIEISAGHTLMQHGDSSRARALLSDALAIYRGLGDQANTAWGLASLSFASIGQVEEYESALASCEEGISLFRGLGDGPWLSAALHIKGKLALARGDLGVAEEAHMEPLDVALETGNRRRESIQYALLGMVHQSKGEFHEAEEYLRRCLVLSWEIGYGHMVAMALAALAGPLGSRGDLVKAARLLGASTGLLHVRGTRTEAADQPTLESCTCAVQQQMSTEAFESAFEQGLRMEQKDAVAYALGG
jgi:predicted ATPase/DNA-binding CsgD family transcriptional regulator